MGHPAFNMTAFEAAQEALAARPLAATAIFSAEPFNSRADVIELRESVRKSTDEIIARYLDWRSGALSGVGNLRALLGQAASHLPASMLSELLARNIEQISGLQHDYNISKVADAASIKEAYIIIDQHQMLPLDIQRFFRKEVRRIEKMAAERARAYERIIFALNEIAEKLELHIRNNSLISAKELSEKDLADHLSGALNRQPDLQGVADRTARRLKAFPKVAAYLGR
ncbi:hypothetical protein [Methylobacterium sp. D54C]|jgi:hypothetical protein